MTDVKGKELAIKTPHFCYAAKQWGDEQGIPTLALHGWLDNAATFDFLAPLLPELNLVALDFPGHGFSGHRPPGFKYHYLDYVADVITVVDALKWDRFNLMGHSLGAGVAGVTAGSFPDRIAKLVLLEGIAPMTGDSQKSPQYLARSIHQMKQIGKRKPPVYKAKSDLIAARFKAGDMKLTSVAALVDRGTVAREEGVTWRSDPRLRVGSPSYLMDDQVFSFLEHIEAATLLVVAEKGLFSDRKRLEKCTQRIKNLHKVEIKGGHHVHLDDPETVALHVSSFL
jgi:pimeloyl-ACP methyl ester carboxylesterase